MIQSQEDESVHCCVVYDKRSGDIVHIHHFVGGLPEKALGATSREKVALEGASKVRAGDLETLSLDEGVELQPDMDYRVDLSTKQLIGTQFSLDAASISRAANKK